MSKKYKTRDVLIKENEELRSRVNELEAALEQIEERREKGEIPGQACDSCEDRKKIEAELEAADLVLQDLRAILQAPEEEDILEYAAGLMDKIEKLEKLEKAVRKNENQAAPQNISPFRGNLEIAVRHLALFQREGHQQDLNQAMALLRREQMRTR